MGWFTGIVLYVLIWWTALFAVLPFGVHPVADADNPAGWGGAPDRPMIGRKIMITTAISALIWLAIFALNQSGWISFRSGWLAMPDR